MSVNLFTLGMRRMITTCSFDYDGLSRACGSNASTGSVINSITRARFIERVFKRVDGRTPHPLSHATLYNVAPCSGTCLAYLSSSVPRAI